MTESGLSRALAALNLDSSVERAYCRHKAEVCCELQVAVNRLLSTQETPSFNIR